MPFNPKELTPPTVKGFVDRLHRFAKTTDASAWPPKRAWSQEAVARALGFSSYHALHVALDSSFQPEKKALASPSWEFESPSGHPFFRVSEEWYTHRTSETCFSVPMDLWKEPLLVQGEERERRRMFESIANQAISHDFPILWIQGPWALSAPSTITETPFKTDFSLGSAVNALLETQSGVGLTEIIVGLMDDVGEENVLWKGRAISMISSVLLALVYLRDNQAQPLTVSVLREAILLENVYALSLDSRLPPHVVQSLKAYLRSIPGSHLSGDKGFSEVERENHGYLQMQFTRILGCFDEQHGRIRLAKYHAIALSETTEKSIIFPWLVENWIEKNPGGVLFLDGLSGKSSLLSWLPRAIPRWVEKGVRIALGTRYLNDWALPAEAMQPLLSRFPNGFLMGGAQDDPWALRAEEAGWKTIKGKH